MKSNLTLAIAFVLIAGIFTSCSTSVQITKRHYKSGYYVDISSNKAKKAEAKQENNVTSMNKLPSTVEGASSETVPAKMQPRTFSYEKKAVKSQAVASVAKPEIKEAIESRESKAAEKVATAIIPTATTSLALDERTLLILWIGFAVGAILFGFFFWPLGAILAIGALVFFILWLLEITK